jgi:hypothetical protein
MLTVELNKKQKVYVDVAYGYVGDKPMETYVDIYNNPDKTELLTKGVAICHKMDAPNKLYGRRQALKSALKNTNWSKENRRKLYEAVIPKLAKPVKQENNVEENESLFNYFIRVVGLYTIVIFSFYWIGRLLGAVS